MTASALRILVLTGAGVSAESGIPTFRGKEGYWTVGSREYHPQEMATQAAFSRMPDEVWRWYLYRRAVCRGAAPNPAHLALAALEQQLGDEFLLVTQNVDGLHIRAGNSLERTYQIHGNIDFMRCASACSPELYEIPASAPLLERDAPLPAGTSEILRCPRCGARTRPHVLWFDEYYDEELYRFQSSLAAVHRADMLIVAGTSASTNLPNQMVALAARRGIPIFDINPGDNPFAHVAERSPGGGAIRATAGEALPVLIGELSLGPA
jgi:NAD-dependent deacetylase